jgi:hypothetical protein
VSARLKNLFMLLVGLVLAAVIIYAACGCSASGTVDGNVPDAQGTYVVSVDDGEFSVDPYTPGPTPTVTVTATPAPTPTPTLTFSATPTVTPTIVPGAVNIAPGGNIQAAVDSLGTDGGTIVFAPGTYTVSEPVKLPHSLASTLTLSGYGATIKLANTKPRFLAWNRTGSGQVFRNVTVEGFTVDAQGKHPSSGSYSVLGFDDANIGGYGTPSSISVDDLTVRDCTVTNVATSPTSAWNACGVNVFTSGTGSITDVRIENVRIEGGSRGVNVWGADSSSNVTIDRLTIRGCWHDTMVNPTSFSASTNYHVGQFAKVGTFALIDSYGNRALDCGVEIDNAANGLVQGCVVENAYYNEYYYTNFRTPLSGAGVTTFANCTANTWINVRGGTALTIGDEGVAIGRVNLDDFSAELEYGTGVLYQVNGVTWASGGGLYVDGTKTSVTRQVAP